jgi:transcriptional antiterminator NusG
MSLDEPTIPTSEDALPGVDEEAVAAADAATAVDDDVTEAPEPAPDPVSDTEPNDSIQPGSDAADAAGFAEPGQDVDPETGEILSPVVDAEALIEESAPYDNPADRPGKWYVVHTQSGYEKKVKQNLEARTSSMNMEGRIHEVVIPLEDVVEFKNGKKVVVQKKMFPGYLLVRCHLDDDSWYVIRNTPGVTGFVGQGTKPSPLRRREVETFLTVKVEGDEAPVRKGRPRTEYELHETVRVKEGPFADFSGEIIEINEDQLKVKVLVNIFGRETPVELEFSQVAKL